MKVSTSIPSGNGRVLRADPEQIEIELIAYDKEARYVHCQISEIEASRRQPVVLRPDRYFIIKEFQHFHQHVWIREGARGKWRVLEESTVEKTPEGVRFILEITAGKDIWFSTEPPRTYAETTSKILALHHQHPRETRLHGVGYSLEERPILALRISTPENLTAPGEEQCPVIHVAAGEHGIEFAGEEMGRGMLAYVLTDKAEYLRQKFIFDFVLNTNPDGTFHGWHNYNMRDWRDHNYSNPADRSWHHEFVPYLRGLLPKASPETQGLMNWLRRTTPALYISLHSWHGYHGHPGAFHVECRALAEKFRDKLEALNENALAAANTVGCDFFARESCADGRHLGDFLMAKGICPAYLPEAHMNLGRERLQQLGREMLVRWLGDPRLAPTTTARAAWERHLT